MKRNLQKPSADKRPLPKRYLDAKDIMKLEYEDALTALLDYDGPIRAFLESLISQFSYPIYTSQFKNTDSLIPEQIKVLELVSFPPFMIENWKSKAMEIMNAIYKLNGLKVRWHLPKEKAK